MLYRDENVIPPNAEYMAILPEWRKMADCYDGTRSVKFGVNATKYLPPQRSELEELRGLGEEHRFSSQYEVRKRYAVYENFLRPIITDSCGIMQSRPFTLKFGVKDDKESPPEVVAMRYGCTQYRDGVQGLKSRLNFHQSLFGRYGMLLEIVTDDESRNPRFRVTESPCFSMIDGEVETDRETGHESLKWVLVDESTLKFNPRTKQWETLSKYRILGLDAEGWFYQSVLEGAGAASEWGRFDLGRPDEAITVWPSFRGNRLNFIPLTICNINCIGFNHWQLPAYSDVADISIADYQVDSIYKRAMNNHASPTLVLKNTGASKDEPVFLGGVLRVNAPIDSEVGVSLLETSGSGLGAMRQAKADLRSSVADWSLRELLNGAGAGASGEAIRLRTISGTAAIAEMDKTGAIAIEDVLVNAEVWAGIDRQKAKELIDFRVDIEYLGTAPQLQSVIALLQTNAQTQTLSAENEWALLCRCCPNVFTSFEENEIQKKTAAPRL